MGAVFARILLLTAVLGIATTQEPYRRFVVASSRPQLSIIPRADIHLPIQPRAYPISPEFRRPGVYALNNQPPNAQSLRSDQARREARFWPFTSYYGNGYGNGYGMGYGYPEYDYHHHHHHHDDHY